MNNTNGMEKVFKVVADYIGSENASDLIKHLFEVGAHYGHPTRAWDPQMAKFIRSVENKNHTIDLRYTVSKMLKAFEFLYFSAKINAKILFVCTDDQMSDTVENEVTRCGQYYVTKRWRGGLLTNWLTTKHSIDNMHKMEKTLAEFGETMKKKERLTMQRNIDKARSSLGGIEKIGTLPDVVIISNLINESIAVEEVRRLQKLGVKIKSIGFADTNSNPNNVDYAIPMNDDSIRVIEFVLKLISNVILEGLVDSDAAPDLKIAKSMPENATVSLDTI